jgi:hypothetical protein
MSERLLSSWQGEIAEVINAGVFFMSPEDCGAKVSLSVSRYYRKLTCFARKYVLKSASNKPHGVAVKPLHSVCMSNQLSSHMHAPVAAAAAFTAVSYSSEGF